MWKKGIFPVHNRFLMTVEFLLDFHNTLTLGSSTIETIQKKMVLLGLCEDISESLEKNLLNHSKDIEMACIAVISLLISPQDMDAVQCLVCGNCPKIVNSGVYNVHRLTGICNISLIAKDRKSRSKRTVCITRGLKLNFKSAKNRVNIHI